jgi:hypothetical protein
MSLAVSLYASLLFFVLSPGVLLKLPKNGSKITVALVHALVFGFLFWLTHKFIWRLTHRLEGMEDEEDDNEETEGMEDQEDDNDETEGMTSKKITEGNINFTKDLKKIGAKCSNSKECKSQSCYNGKCESSDNWAKRITVTYSS